MSRFISGMVAALFFVNSVVTVDLQLGKSFSQKQNMLAPLSTGALSFASVMETLNQIADGKPVPQNFPAILKMLPSYELSRKAVFTLNKLLLQPMPGASEQEFVDAKLDILDAIDEINDGFAQPALVTFSYLLKKKANPNLLPLSPGYTSELVWGTGKTTGALIRELLDSTPLLSPIQFKALTREVDYVRNRLHAEGYQPHWAEHVFPADNLRHLQKAYLDQSPFLLRDLEDAVALSKKEAARGILKEFQEKGNFEVIAPKEAMNALSKILDEDAIEKVAEFFEKNKYLHPKEVIDFFSKELKLQDEVIEKILSKANKDRIDLTAPMKLNSGNRWVALRPNNLGTKFSAADFLWLRDNMLIEDPENPGEKKLAFDSVTIPKSLYPEEVVLVSKLLRGNEKYNNVPLGTVKMGYLIEDPNSAIAAYAFASADPTVIAGNYGVADWTASTGGRPSAQEKFNAALWARKRTVVGFHAATSEFNPRGVDAIEAISVPLTEKDSFADSHKSIRTGFDGKWSVHPEHIKGIQQGPWPFHESRMTRRPLGNWPEDFPYDMKELERKAKEGIPLFERKPGAQKAIQAQRALFVASGSNLVATVAEALAQPLDQLTLDFDSCLDVVPQAVFEAIKQKSVFSKTRLAILINASSLNEEGLKKLSTLMNQFQEAGIQLRGLTLDNVTSPEEIKTIDAFLKQRLEKDPLVRPELFQVQARITSKAMVDYSLLEKRDGVDLYAEAWQGASVKWAADPKTWRLENERLYQIAKASDYVGALIFAVKGLENDPIAKGHMLAVAKAAEVEVIDASMPKEGWEKLADQMAEMGYRGQEVASLDQVEKALEIYSPSPALIKRSLEVTRLYDLADVLGGVGAIGYKRDDGKNEIVDEATAKIDRNVVELSAVADLFDLDQRSAYLRLIPVLHNLRVPFQISKVFEITKPSEKMRDTLKSENLPVALVQAKDLGDKAWVRTQALLELMHVAESSKSVVGQLPILIVEGDAHMGLGLSVDVHKSDAMKSRVIGLTRNEETKTAYLSVTHQTNYEVVKAVVLWLKGRGYDKNHIKIFVDREPYVDQLKSDDKVQRQLAVEQLIAHGRDIRDALEGKEGNVYGFSKEEAPYAKNVPFTASSQQISIPVFQNFLREIAKILGLDSISDELVLPSQRDGSSVRLFVTKQDFSDEIGQIVNLGIHTTVPFVHDSDNRFNPSLPDGRKIRVSFSKKEALAVGDKFDLVPNKKVTASAGVVFNPPVIERVIDDASIRGYAGFSQDRNLHHLNEEWAKINLGGRIAHGMLTSSLGLDRLGEILSTFSKGYTVVEEESSYTAKVPLNDQLRFKAEVVSQDGKGNLKVKLTALNKKGEVVSGNVVSLRVGEKEDSSSLAKQVQVLQLSQFQEPQSRADYLSKTFVHVGPFAERPAPQFSVGDQMEYTWTVSQEKINAFASIFEGNAWADLLIGKAVSAKASSSMAPGSILLGSRVLQMLRPIPAGETLRVKATIVNLRKSSKGDDILTEHIQISDASGNLILHAQVTKQVQSAYEEKKGITSLRPEPISESEKGLPLTPQAFDIEKILDGEPADLAAKPWQNQWGTSISKEVQVTGSNFAQELVTRMQVADYPIEKPIMEFYDDQGNSRKVSPKKLLENVYQLALDLQQKMGIQKGDRVVLMLPNGYESRVAMLATLLIGGILVPLDGMYSEAELKARLEDAQPKVVIAASQHQEFINSVLNGIAENFVQDLIFEDGENNYFQSPIYRAKQSSLKAVFSQKIGALLDPVHLRRDGSDTAILQYKAGQELGQVQGIEISHRNLIAAVSRRAEITFPSHIWKKGEAKLVYSSPEYHVWGYMSGIFIPLWAGQGSITIPDLKKESKIPYIDLLYRALTEGDATHFFGVPTIFSRLKEKMTKEGKVASPTYKVFVSAAASLNEDLRLSFEALTNGNFVQAYGQKEATVPVHAPVDRPLKPGSVGVPSPGVDILLVDPDNRDSIVPIGPGEKIGELAFLGLPEVAAKGVWNNTTATRDLQQKYQGKYYRRTGDLVFVDKEGWLYFLSRTDDMINVSGNKLYPGEVEAVLEKNPAVEAAIVVGVPHPEKGNVPVAYVQLKEKSNLTQKELLQFVEKEVAGYKVPREVIFVKELPWKVAGAKKDHAQVRQLAKADGQQNRSTSSIVPMAQPIPTLEELKQGVAISVTVVAALVEQVSSNLAQRSSLDGKATNELIDKDQKAAEEFALMISYLETAKTMLAFLKSRNDLSQTDQKLSVGYLGEALNRIRLLLLDKSEAFGLNGQQVSEAFNQSKSIRAFFAGVNNHQWIEKIGEELLESKAMPSYLLNSEDEEAQTAEAIGNELKKFADAQIRPAAEKIHREDLLVSEKIIGGLAEMGAFGLSIPDNHGGFQEHHWNLPMILATIELSDASLGAAGSLITRPEITSKVIAAGGTEKQKEELLPQIAAGEKMVTVLFSEQNFGSDLANIEMTALLDEKTNEWVLTGSKMWGTFAGRADLGLVLVRTEKNKDGSFVKGHAGLSTILFDKPPVREDVENLPKGVTKEGEQYTYTQETGGVLGWKQDHTSGYRGMHSYTLTFENYRVPADRLIGKRGDGFFLVAKEGLAGGRVQTAGRAIGLMRGAYRETIKYVSERKLFPTKEKPKRTEADFGLTKIAVAKMAMLIHGAQQYTFATAKLLTEGDLAREQNDKKNAQKGRIEASMAKLLFSRFANEVTDMAQQKHGGVGVAEEYAVSRYAIDAQILTIFEGAEEILELRVIAPDFLDKKAKQLKQEAEARQQAEQALAIAI